MLRLLDVFALTALAVVVLLPKPSVEARPAIALDGDALLAERVAAAQDEAFRHLEDPGAAVALAEELISAERIDFAIAALSPFVRAEATGGAVDGRVHLSLAAARAERLEPSLAVAEARRAESICDGHEGTPPCPGGTVARARLIGATMQALVDTGVDPAKQPQRARDQVLRALRQARSGFSAR